MAELKQEAIMDASGLRVLGLGLQSPGRLVEQRVDTDKQPHEVFFKVAADRGAEYPARSVADCARLTISTNSPGFTSIFQHHSYVTARVPRVDCPDHGTKQVKMPWTREGSRFTLLFEQAAMTLMREIPVLAVARIIGVSDTRLWRVIQFYVAQALPKIDLGEVKAVALDGTASKRGYNYVTVFIDLDREQKPVIFVTPGTGKGGLILFRRFLREHGDDHK
ncbi:hypothetical protein DFAR_2980015 [Desulfarculales bacterium]